MAIIKQQVESFWTHKELFELLLLLISLHGHRGLDSPGNVADGKSTAIMTTRQIMATFKSSQT